MLVTIHPDLTVGLPAQVRAERTGSPFALEVVPRLRFSDHSELLLRVHWLAILAGRVRASLAASGGVPLVEDDVKAVMAGAGATGIGAC